MTNKQKNIMYFIICLILAIFFTIPGITDRFFPINLIWRFLFGFGVGWYGYNLFKYK